VFSVQCRAKKNVYFGFLIFIFFSGSFPISSHGKNAHALSMLYSMVCSSTTCNYVVSVSEVGSLVYFLSKFFFFLLFFCLNFV
jgi:hypothetical protein